MITIDDNVISLTRGDSAAVLVELVDTEGYRYIPDESDRIRFAMSKNYGDEEPLIIKEVDHESMQVYINPEDTKGLDFGSYVYDVEVTDGSGHVVTVLMSKFKITKEVY